MSDEEKQATGTAEESPPEGKAAEKPKEPEPKRPVRVELGKGSFALPYVLPSRGVLYGDKCPGGQTIIHPIRGEQEELLAGAGDGVEATPVFRLVLSQLVELGDLPYESLLVTDWTALFLNLLAFSYSPIMQFRPRCPHCKKFFPKSVNIEEMEVKELDEKRAAEWVEPFKTAPLPVSGAVVHFRLLRLSDMIQAEDYARQQESHQMVPKSALHTYTLAKHIVKVNADEMNILTAKSWVKDAFSKDLRALQAEFSKWETGYELTPEFLCVHCGALFRARLPLDGSFFRAASSGDGGASPPTI